MFQNIKILNFVTLSHIMMVGGHPFRAGASCYSPLYWAGPPPLFEGCS